METIEEMYHPLGDEVKLSGEVTVTVEIRDEETQCKGCYFDAIRHDCGEIRCNYHQRKDNENVIFILKS